MQTASLPALRRHGVVQLNAVEPFVTSWGLRGSTQGGTLGSISVSIRSVGADTFQFIQGIDSIYRIRGSGRT
jgi:hypothetical protein